MLKKFFDRQKEKTAMKAAHAGDFDRAFAVLETGGDINACYYVGDPEYGGGEGNIGYAAIQHGNLAALEKALDKGLDPSLQSWYRAPLLVYAIQQRQEDAAKLLISRGAEVNGFLLSDFFSPLALARIYDMPKVESMIAAKLSPGELAQARAHDIPRGETAQPASKPRAFNP